MHNEPDWVTQFRTATLELDKKIADLTSSDLTVEDACNILVALNIIKGEVALVYSNMEKVVSNLLDNQPEITLEDGSKIEKKWASDRKGWQHKNLADVVAHRLIESSVDMDTGEVLLTQEQIITKLLDFLQPSYWRVKELSKLGINADMYCEVGDTKSSIIVRKAK